METRWAGITRPYPPEDVERLRGSLRVQHTIADRGARRLWQMLEDEPWVSAVRAASAGEAVAMARAGARAIRVSDRLPGLVRRVSRALQQSDEAEHAEGSFERDWFVPIVADAGAGPGDAHQAFELTRALIEAGAAAVCLDDRLASEGAPAGERVLVPTSAFVRTLVAARLAADVAGVPTVLVARIANGATLLASDADPRDREFVLAGARTAENCFRLSGGIERAIARADACAPYADVLSYEALTADLAEARAFAEGVQERHPGKRLAYDASIRLGQRLDDETRAGFEAELRAAGYRLQLGTEAGRPVGVEAATLSSQARAAYRDRIVQVVAGGAFSTPEPRERKTDGNA